MSLLLADVTIGDRPGRAMHVVDGRIAWVGEAADAPAADRTVAGEGALLTPAFVDSHVHATSTGLALTGLDLHSSSSLAETVALVARFAQRSPGIVLGTGWDETGWPERRGLTRADLDAVLGYRPAYLARVDVHSATVSTALLESIPGIADLAGFSPDGRLRLDAHHAGPTGRLRHDQRGTAPRSAAGHPGRGGRAGHRQPARDGRPGGLRRRRPHRPADARRRAARPRGRRLLGRAGRARRPRRRPRAGPGRRRGRPVLRRRPRLAHRGAGRRAVPRPAGHRGHPAVLDRAAGAPRPQPARRRGSRPAST